MKSRIILMRHGKPIMPKQTAISAYEFRHWIEAYNQADICTYISPSKEAIEIARSCNVAFCSNLKRSVDSANILGITDVDWVDHTLREMEMPWSELPGLKLKPIYWAVIFRMLWFAGYSKNSESFKEAKQRANNAANQFQKLAKEKGNLLFIGHGLMNKYIAKSLIENYWLIKQKGSSQYWDFSIFESGE